MTKPDCPCWELDIDGEYFMSEKPDELWNISWKFCPSCGKKAKVKDE